MFSVRVLCSVDDIHQDQWGNHWVIIDQLSFDTVDLNVFE